MIIENKGSDDFGVEMIVMLIIAAAAAAAASIFYFCFLLKHFLSTIS